MIAFPSIVRVWLSVGRTDMRRSMNGLALQVQQALGRDPHAGDLYVFSMCAFTRFGIECPRYIIDEVRRAGSAPPKAAKSK